MSAPPAAPAEPDPGRDVRRSRRRPLRRRATARERQLAFEKLKADCLRERPDLSESEAAKWAADELKRMEERNPRVEAAQRKLAPIVQLPDRDEIHEPADLAAALAQPEMVEVMQQIAHTTAARGRVADLSSAAAALALMAHQGGSCIAKNAFCSCLAGSLAWSWGTGHPDVNVDQSTLYRRLVALAGRGGILGHDHEMLVLANLAMVRRLRNMLADGKRVGKLAALDGYRMRAPVVQDGVNTPDYLKALRRSDMEKVEVSTYRRDGRSDTIVGWKLLSLTELATGCPLVWVVVRGGAYEAGPELVEDLLPLLFRIWPDCPLHTLVIDSLYDTEPFARELIERFSIQPIAVRIGPSRRRRVFTGGREVEVVDGRPRCQCGPMRFKSREGFVTPDVRRKLGFARGDWLPPEEFKKARVRWVCPNKLCNEVHLYAHWDYRDHTYWPRNVDTPQGAIRRALELYRNIIESAFNLLKHNGVGPKDNCALWARDSGIAWLVAMHGALLTARKLAHVTGDYQHFADEYLELGFGRSGHPPTVEQVIRAEEQRPTHLRWRWPDPGRLGDR